ncbi:hypothetical protein N0V90_010422 [Kalmusia sp. IMI 367209]|nr:hypothetical protein N0V90_010422 [Kalmusia sp. IMI 367209]
MSFDKEIGAPFTLASLPHPISTRDGRTHAASVCSISGTRKRKRTEIAVGLDGEGISIYSLQNPQLVTSYALPPQTSFASAPYSVYYKGSSKRSSRRYTYAFISQETPGIKPHLVCFSEDTRKDTTIDIVKSSYTPTDGSQRVIAIDVVPVPFEASQQQASHEVLVVFGNGDVICLSLDLDVVRWVANISALTSLPKEVLEIDYASLDPARALTHGLLKNRADLVAILNPSLDDTSDLLDLTHILSVIRKQTDGRRTLDLFQIQPRSADLLGSRLQPLKHLTTWNLPESDLESDPRSDSTRHQFIVHASNGALYHLSDSGLLTYDFSGTVPKTSSEMSKSTLAVDSILRISQDLIFAASPKACRIINVKYDSIHAECLLERSMRSLTNDVKKRKHTAPEPSAPSSTAPAFIAYYADLGLAVGSWNDELIGFQLGDSTRRKRFRFQGTRLIDSLGKGISLHSDANDFNRLEWRDKAIKLDKYAKKGEVAKFEKIFAVDLDIQLEKKSKEAEGKLDAELVNEDHDLTATSEKIEDGVLPTKAVSGTQEETTELPRKWILSKMMSAAERSRRRQYAAFALSRIFRWVDSPSSQGPSGYLKIEFFPPNIFQWLMQSGNLTKESIRRAILDDPSSNLSISTPIRNGDIIRAVVTFDPELHILSAILNHGHFLPISEVVEAIKLLMQSLDDHSKAGNVPKLLTNGTEPHADAMDIDIASELEAASHEIDRALAILYNGPTVINDTLRPALIRLHTFPPAVVSSTLRSMLSRQDLESLVKLLHHELKNGGWTSPYDFGDSEVPESDPSSEEIDDSAVAIIASLISCTLDAIGPAIWLTSVGDTSTDELIQELREDAEEALTGFWEARYIRGILSELLRYNAKAPKSKKPSSKILEKQGKPFTLDLNPDELPMLPLGAKPDAGVEKTKAGKGGQRKERSAREMGMLISKRVPKYSFERITI